MPSLQELVDQFITGPMPGATVHVAIFQAVSRAVVAEGNAIMFAANGPIVPTVVIAESPFANDDMEKRSPQGVRYYIACAALADRESTMRYLVYVASYVSTLLQLSANAGCWPLKLRLMIAGESSAASFRQLPFEAQVRHPINARNADIEATQELWYARWSKGDDRVARAAVQYELALRRLEYDEFPLALLHVYMGVEAVTKEVTRAECSRLQVSEEELGRTFGLDPAMDLFGRALESQVRRQLIFHNDATTYNAISRARNGILHGFATWNEIWATPETVIQTAARYLRHAILNVSGLAQPVLERLESTPFDSYIERGPLIAYESTADVRGVDLHATDLQIVTLRREMTTSTYEAARGEYRYEYSLEADSS
jgi:hypothetical protein